MGNDCASFNIELMHSTKFVACAYLRHLLVSIFPKVFDLFRQKLAEIVILEPTTLPKELVVLFCNL